MRPLSATLSILVLLSAIGLAVAAPAAPPDDAVLRQKIVGSWGQTLTCTDGRLIFNADGTFVSAGRNPDGNVTGTYVIDQGRLTGHSGDTDMPAMLVGFDGDVLLLDDGSGDQQRLNRCQTAQ